MLLLVTNLHEKKHYRKSGQTKFWQHMHYFQFALWCYNFALVLQYCICVTWKMHTIFSLIYNFFMYITRKKIMMGSFDLIRFVTSYVLLRRNLVLSACDIILAWYSLLRFLFGNNVWTTKGHIHDMNFCQWWRYTSYWIVFKIVLILLFIHDSSRDQFSSVSSFFFCDI